MKIRICPKCRSKEIEDVTAQPNNFLLSHYSSPRIYRCKKCGFENPIFPEKEINQKQHQKLKDKQ